jgi:hypothetical protein
MVIVRVENVSAADARRLWKKTAIADISPPEPAPDGRFEARCRPRLFPGCTETVKFTVVEFTVLAIPGGRAVLKFHCNSANVAAL